MLTLDSLDPDLDRVLDLTLELVPCSPFGVDAVLLLVLEEEVTAFRAVGDGPAGRGRDAGCVDLPRQFDDRRQARERGPRVGLDRARKKWTTIAAGLRGVVHLP